MSVLIALLITALIGLSAWLIYTLERMQKKLAALHERLHATPALPLATVSGKSRIAIEILNPFELAARETRFAGAAAKLAPRMIERIVYERAAVMIAQQMAEQGVQAEVKAHVT
ncbi:MAG: hypothetical protein V4709_10755 [Pseudomonadota bacterium]